jgi:hypothetical protein
MIRNTLMIQNGKTVEHTLIASSMLTDSVDSMILPESSDALFLRAFSLIVEVDVFWWVALSLGASTWSAESDLALSLLVFREIISSLIASDDSDPFFRREDLLEFPGNFAEFSSICMDLSFFPLRALAESNEEVLLADDEVLVSVMTEPIFFDSERNL